MTPRGSSAKKGAASAADEREVWGDLASEHRPEEEFDRVVFVTLGGGDVEVHEPVKVRGLHLPPGSVETV